MDFILTYRIDIEQAFSEEFMIDKMKEALKFITCSQLKRNTVDDNFVYTCSENGPQCFSCTFHKVTGTNTWKIAGGIPKHAKNCEKEGQTALFIKTMMLFKLRKEYFEDFLIENQLIGKTPRNILLVYSRKRHNLNYPFYEVYLKDQSALTQVKKKWANLMDAIRRQHTKDNELPAEQTTTLEAQHSLAPLAPLAPLAAFAPTSILEPILQPQICFSSQNPLFDGLFSLNDNDNDKENIMFEAKFDRVMQKPPEVQELKPRQNTQAWPSAFGSLPDYMINSSLQKQSLRQITDFQASLFF